MPPVDRKNPKRAASSESDFSLMEFMGAFPNDDACLDYLWTTRYSPDGDRALCPHCEVERTFRHYAEKRQAWTCVACGYRIYVTAGTIFHKSSTSLHLWFYAMYLMSSTRCGISAKQLERELGVTYKTAWRMFTLIRNELMGQDDDLVLNGRVEMDEMYVGGRPRLADKMAKGPRATGAWRDKKTEVFGAVERGGRVTAHVIPSRRTPTIMGHVQKRVDASAIVYTDQARQYWNLPQEHHTIAHHEGIYVSGDVHTNTIEGFWSLVKRGISGTHHSVSPKWLQGYLNEYVWRYNHRDDRRAMFALLLLRAANPPA